jgi:HSP20 family molecular chaperone IbpA
MVPSWENGQDQSQHHEGRRQTISVSRMDRDHRRRLAVAVRTLLYRQHRAYHRRMVQLQDQCNQQIQKYSQSVSVAASELMENDTNLRLTLDLPGINKEDINVQIDTSANELQIKAKRSYMSIDGATCVSTNMKCRRYSINVDVVDVFQIHATLQYGVLTITAHKKNKIKAPMDAEMQDAAKDSSNIVTHDGDKDGGKSVEGRETSTIIHIAISDY